MSLCPRTLAQTQLQLLRCCKAHRSVQSLLPRPSFSTSSSSPPRPSSRTNPRPRRCNHLTLPHRSPYSVPASELQFGQPVHETHPHLLQPGELTPGITAHEFHLRRSRLANALPKHGVVILAAADVKYKSGSVFYEYTQDRDFLYLTGWNEPESLAVLTREDGGNGEDGADYKFWLFVRGKDRKAELWDGARNGVDAAREVFNADEAEDIENVKNFLPDIISGASEIHTNIKTAPPPTILSRFLSGSTPSSGSNSAFNKILEKSNSSRKLRPIRPLLNSIRILKSPAEIKNMRIAGQASGRAFTETMHHSFPSERLLDAHLEYQFRQHGCDGISFEPVVACGRNALSIHYVRNDDVLRDGEMVLVDGGGEHGGYIADITRTFPVNGKFTAAQRDLYNAVLAVQRDCIALCRASAQISLDRLHSLAEEGLKVRLADLGFDMRDGAIETLFPHHLSHYIGLDVHDCPGYSRKDDLKDGMCVTVEPGIYVPDDDRWPKQFRGVGIRIEDSVAVGGEVPTVLTVEAVKEVDDVEALRG